MKNCKELHFSPELWEEQTNDGEPYDGRNDDNFFSYVLYHLKTLQKTCSSRQVAAVSTLLDSHKETLQKNINGIIKKSVFIFSGKEQECATKVINTKESLMLETL